MTLENTASEQVAPSEILGQQQESLDTTPPAAARAAYPVAPDQQHSPFAGAQVSTAAPVEAEPPAVPSVPSDPVASAAPVASAEASEAAPVVAPLNNSEEGASDGHAVPPGQAECENPSMPAETAPPAMPSETPSPVAPAEPVAPAAEPAPTAYTVEAETTADADEAPSVEYSVEADAVEPAAPAAVSDAVAETVEVPAPAAPADAPTPLAAAEAPVQAGAEEMPAASGIAVEAAVDPAPVESAAADAPVEAGAGDVPAPAAEPEPSVTVGQPAEQSPPGAVEKEAAPSPQRMTDAAPIYDDETVRSLMDILIMSDGMIQPQERAFAIDLLQQVITRSSFESKRLLCERLANMDDAPRAPCFIVPATRRDQDHRAAPAPRQLRLGQRAYGRRGRTRP